MSDAAKVAQKFHEAHERLAPAFALEGVGLSWAQLDEDEQHLRTAVVAHLIGTGVIMALPGGTD